MERTDELRAYQREYQQAWRARNPEKVREIQRKHRELNRDEVNRQKRERRAADPEKARAEDRVWRERNRLRQHAHLTEDERAAIWDAQGGCCYLCGEPMTEQNARIDHDYSCCPRNASCPRCRRGLAHHRCNILIGMAEEDPQRLRRMADALEAAQQSVRSSALLKRSELA